MATVLDCEEYIEQAYFFNALATHHRQHADARSS